MLDLSKKTLKCYDALREDLLNEAQFQIDSLGCRSEHCRHIYKPRKVFSWFKEHNVLRKIN